MAFDVVGELVFGRKCGFLEDMPLEKLLIVDRDIGWIRQLEIISLPNTWTGEVPDMLPIICRSWFNASPLDFVNRRTTEIQIIR